MMGSKILISILVVAAAYMAGRHYFPPVVKSPIVEIHTGKLQGRISQSRDGREYFEYLGIPYVQAPVGQLRYEPPVHLTDKWDGVRDATSKGSTCIQVNGFLKQVEGKEDCLFVNVATPKLAEDANLPVMVWFHGGIFSFGEGYMYRPDYLMDEDVVVVSVNYRLASFGFLNTGDGVIRGNMGLKDQNAALIWVKHNIHKFGGNRNDVTIFGESAGGASVHYQMLSPMSKGLFHKAIAQSGLTTMPWATYPNPAKQVKRFAGQVNCPNGNTKEIVECLKSKDAMELVSAHLETSDNLRPLIKYFLPTIEKEMNDGKSFLTEKPRAIIESGKFNNVPLMAGVNDAEGLLVSIPSVANRTLIQHLVKDWAKTIVPIMMLPEDVGPDALKKIKAHYMTNGDMDLENPSRDVENLTNLFGDWAWNVGFHNGMMIQKKWINPIAPIFLYYYTYEGVFSLDQLLVFLKGDYHPILEILLGKLNNWYRATFFGETVTRYGACHGDELAMLFNVEGLSSVPTGHTDYEFSKKIINLYMQFVKLDVKSTRHGTLELLGESWTSQDPKKPLQYFQIGLKPKMIPEPFTESIEFWNPLKLLP